MNKDGTVYESSGLADPSVNVRPFQAGLYYLKFDRDVSSCAWVVSRATDQGIDDYDQAVQMTAFGLGAFGEGNDTVEVDAINPNGNSFTDQAFSLVVVCP